MPRADRAWPATPQSVRGARVFVREQLEQWGVGEHVWVATTVISELVTNAVLHARTDFSVTVELAGPVLTLRVADASPTVPVRRRYDDAAATGRGLALLEELTSGWGVEATGAGKVVWCTIDASVGAGSTAVDAGTAASSA